MCPLEVHHHNNRCLGTSLTLISSLLTPVGWKEAVVFQTQKEPRFRSPNPTESHHWQHSQSNPTPPRLGDLVFGTVSILSLCLLPSPSLALARMRDRTGCVVLSRYMPPFTRLAERQRASQGHLASELEAEPRRKSRLYSCK